MKYDMIEIGPGHAGNVNEITDVYYASEVSGIRCRVNINRHPGDDIHNVA